MGEFRYDVVDGWVVVMRVKDFALCHSDVWLEKGRKKIPLRLSHTGQVFFNEEEECGVIEGEWIVRDPENLPVLAKDVERALNSGAFPFPCCGGCI